MTTRRILLIDGHPDPGTGRLCHALVEAYADGARHAAHETETVRIADMDIEFLESQEAFRTQQPAPALKHVQDAITRADHIVLFYPLWLGTMPAKLKALLEQVFRPGFAFEMEENALWHRKLKGRSARVVVTMGMPAFFYRWYFRAHSLKSLERNILKFCGIAPVRETLLGMVEGVSDAKRRQWLEKMQALGAAAR